ncbi:response regulator transcription factor [Aliarcobacter cryaerophilus]|uniref:response regulator transcription factor n=1 Tax=Aliarcobacter TaxID=2321111 RepID=UPI0021B29F3F|nr:MULTISPECIES: response regulator transcription factor [Aliarcobacter]MCT7529569.1 response regulator transcription factor [Aliarcobacter cryaerophilus]MCT7595590.1 response regulator transcription factor [Aliarcobacter butzleri]
MIKDINILKSLNILYAEDDLVIKESTTRILKMFFKEVFVANDGNETLEIYQNHKIDVIMLDYVMPNLDGYQTAKIIRELNKKIPIIIVSAYTDKEKLLNAIELNLIKYIEKPILHDDLVNVLNSVISSLKNNNLILTKLDENSYYSFVSKKIIKNDKEIVLTKNEVTFIELLLDKPNQLISKELIENEVFKESVDENTLRNMVYRLRKKLDSDSIVTIKDLGYLIKI